MTLRELRLIGGRSVVLAALSCLLPVHASPPQGWEVLPAEVRFDESLIETGDLIFRRGTGLVSRAVQVGDRASEYTHVGIAVVRDGRRQVLHAAPGEPGVRLEPIDTYLAGSPVVGVRRVGGLNADEMNGAVAAAIQYLGAPFDSALDLSSDDEVYCTELVWLAFRATGIELIDEPHPVRMPFRGTIEAILPSQLLSSEKVEPILDVGLEVW